MTKSKTVDMTSGNPLSLLIRFAIPLILSSLFQQLYSLLDTVIVGRLISGEALTAVGITGALNFLVLGFTMGGAIGFGIPLAQAVGEGDNDEVSRFFWNGLYLSCAIGLIISIGSGIFTRQMLVLMNTPAELLDMATEYLTIIFLGQITSILYNYLAGVLRALGDSIRPFVFLVISSLINVGIDLLLILVVPMGVTGPALGTVIGQGISAAMCAVWINRRIKVIKRKNKNGESLARLSLERIKRLCTVGLPLGLEYSVCSIGNVVLQGSINALGAVAATAQICGERIRAIATMPMESIGTAMATYAGQNYGAKRIDRIKSGIRAGLTIQGVYCLVAWVVLLFLKKPAVYLILGDIASSEAVAAVDYLSIITLLFIFHGSLMIFRNTVQGMGFGASALASSVMEIVGRSAAGLLAVRFGSFFFICISAPMAWIPACICCLCLCAYYVPREARRFEAKIENEEIKP